MPITLNGSTGVVFPAGGTGNTAGAAVGTTDTQTLTNKTLTNPQFSTKVQQIVTSVSGTLATGTTTIPADNTIPQITEGDQYLSVSITPTSASSTLEIDVTINLSSTSSSVTLTAALFQDSTANALAASSSSPTGSNYIQCITFKHFMTAGTTSATTFKVRAGGSSAGTTAVNGWSGAQFYGGVLSSRITVKEYLP